LRLSGDTPRSDHLVTLRPDRSDQDEKRSLRQIIIYIVVLAILAALYRLLLGDR
jgi:hypothetical protein